MLTSNKGDSFYMYSIEDVRLEDPQIAELIEAEVTRQNSHIELIASENWVSHAVPVPEGEGQDSDQPGLLPQRSEPCGSYRGSGRIRKSVTSVEGVSQLTCITV